MYKVVKHNHPYLGVDVSIYKDNIPILYKEKILRNIANEIKIKKSECIDKIRILDRQYKCNNVNECSLRAIIEFNGEKYYYHSIYGYISTDRIKSLSDAEEELYNTLIVYFCY